MGAVTGIDALNQGMAVVAISGMVAEHKVETGLVEGNRVKGCQDADIVHLRGGGVAVAVAVDRQVVHHINIYDAVFTLEVIVYSLCRAGHRFEKSILTVRLLEEVLDIGICTGGVNQRFAFGSGDTDALVFDDAPRSRPWRGL